ncbi:MAG: putative family peptidase [Gemmatimonadetes bacterium]|jgi:aminopeptidase N|nr:putative family peptidase [Gemmatimonadota bacterium]
MPMFRRLLNSPALVALLLALAAADARAQAAPRPASAYHPGIDVTDYDIRLELPDTGAFLRGDVTVTARREAGVRTLRLDLASRLTVRSVMVNGTTVQAERTGATLAVPLEGAAGDSVQVRVRYDGIVTDGLIVRHDARGRWTWFADNWPNRARQWLPMVDHPSDKATVSFTVRAPSSRTVVANGTLLGVRPLTGAEEGRSETRWRETRPIATYLMVIGAGQLVRTDLRDSACVASTVHRCVAQMVYASPDVNGYLPGPFAAAPAIVSYFEELVGPFPYEKLAHLQSSTRFGGMENASAIFYADRLFTERTLGDDVIAHETAHQWFGDAVTEREWGHVWLSEGFATYFAALWSLHAHGDDAFRKEMGEIREQILADSVVARRPVLDTLQRDLMALLNTNSYQKGGYVLFMLHGELGDSAFFRGLRSYYAKYRDGNATTDDLRRELEASSGHSLGEFFDQWLGRPGVPAVQVGWAFDPQGGQLALEVIQEGPAPPYRLRIPVEITYADGRIVRTDVEVPAVARSNALIVKQMGGRPRAVVIDRQHLMLARLTRL